MNLKQCIRQLVPRPMLSLYHWVMSWATALGFGLPGRKMVVIGITGTKGKSTTSVLTWHLLTQAGFKVGLISTVLLAVGKTSWISDLKMTTPGRAKLNSLLKRMAREGCTYVVLETSSEALAQWRHVGINYGVAVFTNLSPEHLEAHGGFKNYRKAKLRLFQGLTKFRVLSGVKPAAVINLDDKAAPVFLNQGIYRKIGYTTNQISHTGVVETLVADIKSVTPRQSRFAIGAETVELPLGGNFNISNALAALGVARALGLKLGEVVPYLKNFTGVPGRLEFIEQGQSFQVAVDYAHTEQSLSAVYELLSSTRHDIIAVLGACGGGRDKAKRIPLGQLAGRYAKTVIVTNEDPYDEDPLVIMQAVAKGAQEMGKHEGRDLFIIPDRRQAIVRALTTARAEEVVIITGKGAEQWLCEAGGKMVPWDDRKVVMEELNKL